MATQAHTTPLTATATVTYTATIDPTLAHEIAAYVVANTPTGACDQTEGWEAWVDRAAADVWLRVAQYPMDEACYDLKVVYAGNDAYELRASYDGKQRYTWAQLLAVAQKTPQPAQSVALAAYMLNFAVVWNLVQRTWAGGAQGDWDANHAQYNTRHLP